MPEVMIAAYFLIKHSRATIVYYGGDWGSKYKVRTFDVFLTRFLGGPNGPKIVLGGPKPISRTGPQLPLPWLIWVHFRGSWPVSRTWYYMIYVQLTHLGGILGHSKLISVPPLPLLNDVFRGKDHFKSNLMKTFWNRFFCILLYCGHPPLSAIQLNSFIKHHKEPCRYATALADASLDATKPRQVLILILMMMIKMMMTMMINCSWWSQ